MTRPAAPKKKIHARNLKKMNMESFRRDDLADADLMKTPSEDVEQLVLVYNETRPSLLNTYAPMTVMRVPDRLDTAWFGPSVHGAKTARRRAEKRLRERVAWKWTGSFTSVREIVSHQGGAVVVQETTEYIAEINRQLKNEAHYCKVEKDPTSQIAKISNQLMEQLYQMGYSDEMTRRWALVEPSKVQCHRLYTRPKIHKMQRNPPGSPIVSGTSGPTETLSRLVDHWLQDHVKGVDVPSYIQDTADMLRTIQQWNHDYMALLGTIQDTGYRILYYLILEF